MKKLFKKVSSVILCTLMLTAISPISIFAENTGNKSVHAEYKDINQRIIGTIDLSDYANVEGNIVNENNKKVYKGFIEGKIDSKDLFSGALESFNKNFKGKTSIGFPAEHIVMFSAGKSFPSAKFDVNFPENVIINKNDVELYENTNSVSKIFSSENEKNNNKISIIINLGNWNDYAGFFSLVEKDMNSQENNYIKIKIPFEFNIPDNTNDAEYVNYVLSNTKLSGECKLYYNGRLRFLQKYKKPIVDITAKEFTLDINNNGGQNE